MDINYLLGREQHALYLAETSRSLSARVAHRAFAKAYGVLIAGTGFPHRNSNSLASRPRTQITASSSEAQIQDWESEGGSIWNKPDQQSRPDSRNIVTARRRTENIALARGPMVIF